MTTPLKNEKLVAIEKKLGELAKAVDADKIDTPEEKIEAIIEDVRTLLDGKWEPKKDRRAALRALVLGGPFLLAAGAYLWSLFGG